MNTYLAAAVIAASTALAGGAAQAATFSGDFDADFLSFSGLSGSGNGLYGHSDFVRWGNRNDARRSTMAIHDGEFSHELQAGDNLYELGRLEWYNASWRNFDDLFSIRSRFALDIDTPIDTGNNTDIVRIDIDTSNNGSTVPEDAAMLVGFNDFFLGLPVDLTEGYYLQGFDFSVAGDGGLTAFNWTNPEQGTSELIISARITGPSEVPLPAAGVLLLAGLGGLTAMKRRKNK